MWFSRGLWWVEVLSRSLNMWHWCMYFNVGLWSHCVYLGLQNYFQPGNTFMCKILLYVQELTVSAHASFIHVMGNGGGVICAG